jgi:hypothetical protein
MHALNCRRVFRSHVTHDIDILNLHQVVQICRRDVKQNLSFSYAEKPRNAGSESVPDGQLVDGDDELGSLEQLSSGREACYAKFVIEGIMALMGQPMVDPYQSGLLEAILSIFQFDPTMPRDSSGQLFEVLRHLRWKRLMTLHVRRRFVMFFGL